MVGYANFAGSAYKVANPQYAAQVAKLQQLKSILDGDYKWSHREIKEFLINVIIAFASIEGSAGASSLGIDFNDPSSWEKLNKNNDGNGSNNGNGGGNSDNENSGKVAPDSLSEEQLLKLLNKYLGDYMNIDVEGIVRKAQEEILNSQVFKDLTKQFFGENAEVLFLKKLAEEETKRIQADAETLEKTATMLAKEAKDRVDAIAYESQLRANQLEAEARERNQQIFAESRARIEGDEAEVRARNEALDAESKKRQKELQELDKSLKQRIDTVTNEVTNSISTSGQKITELTAKIDSSIESSNQKVSALETKLKKDLTTEVETVTNAIKKSAEKSQNDLLAKANELGTDIQTVSEKAKQNASKIETVTAKSDKALTGIEEERRARIAGDNAESLARTILASTLRNELTAGISEERNTRVSEKEAQATINRNLTSKIGNVENSVTEETKSRIAGDEALGSRITNMSSKVDSSEAKIQTLEQTVATNNNALSKRIDSVNAKIGEVVNGKVTVQVEASIDEFKQSQAEVDRAQTEELNAAKSKIGLNETKITNLQETKASKDEVVSLVRTALTSEWKGEASKAKMEALTEAERIALEKANEAKNAADVAAQAKADAAKAQAIAQSSNDATTKANAAKAQAIADAAAKDAVLKQQAAEDAQRKADKAKNDAIAEARRLNNQTDAKITSLQQTVANNELARAEDAKKITAKFDNLSVGGRNLLIMKRMTTKGYFNPNTGSISGANNDRLDETYYSCESNEDFIGKLHELNGSYGSSARIVFYDNEKRFISAHVIHSSTKGQVYKIVSPQNAAFYRVSVIGADVKAMLERGTIPTDWKPAPEDLEANYSNVLAEFNQYKIAQASKNEAFTTELNTAKSKINNAEANITNLQQTRASKDEVVSLARQGLESVWQGAANQAKNQAITEAQSDVTNKVNAAKLAVENATQAKIIAAKAQTLAEASNDARLKADAAKAAAIADAAAKDAVLKQQMADDAQRKADKAKNDAIEQAKVFNNATDAKITSLQQTVANSELARVEESKQLSAKFDSLVIGSRNLLKKSNVQIDDNKYGHDYELTEAPAVGEDVTVTLWGNLGEGRTDFAVYNTFGYGELAKLKKVSDGIYKASFKWKKSTKPASYQNPDDTHLVVYNYPQSATSNNVINKIKLERGNIGTDWTPAPEDLNAAIAESEAKITEYKNTVSRANESLTERVQNAESRIGQSETKITNIENTKATKTEVVSIARNALQSEWRGFATAEKENAVVQANRIATEKSNAVKEASETYARAQADLAKANAIAASSNDATTKANAAKAQAIADAAAKDLIVKQQAAADATTKANAAKNAAIEEARRLNNATNADITLLRKTVSDNTQAIAEDKKELVAKFNNLSVGGRNLIRNSDANTNDNQYLHKFAITEAPAFGEDVIVTLWGDLGTGRDTFAVYNSRGFGELAQLIKISDGVYQAKFKWADNTYTGQGDKLFNTTLNVYAYPNTSTSNYTIKKVKFERGTVPTDWTPAPEDAESKYSDVESKITETKSTIATAERALTEKIDQAKSSFNSNLTDIENKQRTLTEKDSAFASQLSSLTTKVNNNESAIRREETARTNNDSSLTIKLNELIAKYNLAYAAIKREEKARADADSATTLATRDLTSRLGIAEGKIKTEETTRAEADKSLSAKIESLTSEHKNSKAQLETLKDTYATDKQASASKLSTLESNVKDNKSKLTTLESSLTTKESALSQRIDNLNAEVGKTKASIVSESKARIDEKNAQATVNQTLTNKIGDAEGLIVAERNARTKADESINSNLSGLVGRVGNAEGRITTEERTRVREDNALSTRITNLNSVLNGAKSDITRLQQTVTTKDGARAQEINTLKASMNDMKIGGRNLVRNSSPYVTDNKYLHLFPITEAPAFGEDVVVTLWGQLGQGRTDFAVYNSVGFGELAKLKKIGDGIYQAKFKWADNTYTGNGKTTNVNLNVYAYPNTASSNNIIKRIKFEKGTIPSDWTPAPEDAESSIDSAKADLREYKNVQATKETATSDTLRTLTSKVSTAENKINNIESTKAGKSEVSTLARQSLESVWKKDSKDSAKAEVDSFKQTYTNEQKALSSRIDTLNASLNGAKASIETTKTATTTIDGKINSLYTLKVQAVGNKKTISGLMVGANEAESQFGVIADKFFIGDANSNTLTAPFIVQSVNGQAKVFIKGDLIADNAIMGKHIAAGQTITAPIIRGGSLNINDRFKVMSNGDVLIQASSGNTGMKITSERIDVYDTSGRLRVRMGKLS